MADQPLALAYRPANFRELVGQRPVQYVLFRMIHEVREGANVPKAEHSVPPGLLLTGSRGSGKTSTARILAAALNCTGLGERPCTQCPSCVSVAAGTSLALLEVDAASQGSVEQVRRLRELVSFDSGDDERVVLLDEAHSMAPAAFNALLKIMEEPPPRTIFILVTTERNKIIPTVASRLMHFPFRRIPPAFIQQRLAHIRDAEGLGTEDALLAHLAEQADGGLRDAVMMLDHAQRVGVTTLEQFQVMHGEQDIAPFLVETMLRGDHASLFGYTGRLMSEIGDTSLILARLVDCFRDVLVLHSQGQIAAQGRALEFRQSLARSLTSYQVIAAMKVLWKLRTTVRGIDARSMLELAALMCSEAIQPTPVARPVSAVNGGNGQVHNGNGHKSTIGELQQLSVAAP